MKNEILKGYDDYVEGKRTGKTAMILITVVCVFVVFATLLFSFSLQVKAVDTVKVIDSSGRKIQSETKRENEVLTSSIQAHLSNAFYYLNTFDQNTIKENQARALFLVDKVSANRVFNSYNSRGCYNDAIRNSYIYTANYKKLLKLDGENEPFVVELEGELIITDGDRIKKTRIIGRGKVRYTTPSFPNNPQGFILYDYLQDYQEVDY